MVVLGGRSGYHEKTAAGWLINWPQFTLNGKRRFYLYDDASDVIGIDGDLVVIAVLGFYVYHVGFPVVEYLNDVSFFSVF